LSYEGKPADYQIANIAALQRELEEVTKQFEQLNTKDLPALNDTLKAKGLPAIVYVPTETPSALAARFFNGDTATMATEQD
jgi:hypothetical protein